METVDQNIPGIKRFQRIRAGGVIVETAIGVDGDRGAVRADDVRIRDRQAIAADIEIIGQNTSERGDIHRCIGVGRVAIGRRDDGDCLVGELNKIHAVQIVAAVVAVARIVIGYGQKAGGNFGDRIIGAVAGIGRNVVAATADDIVIATAAGQDIIAAIAGDIVGCIVPDAINIVAAGQGEIFKIPVESPIDGTLHRVRAARIGNHVANAINDNRVIAQAAFDNVVIGAAVEKIIRRSTGQGIVPCAAIGDDAFGCRRSVQNVVSAAAGKGDGVVGDIGAVEIADDQYVVSCAAFESDIFHIDQVDDFIGRAGLLDGDPATICLDGELIGGVLRAGDE